MKNLLQAFRRSFSARLSLWVVLFAALVYAVAQIYIAIEARRTIQNEAVKGATLALENATLRLNNILEDVEVAADNLEWLVYRHLDSPDTLLEYSRSTVQGNLFLCGCSISFEPGFFSGRPYFSAYSSNTDGVVTTVQEGDSDYQYFYLDWYLLPKLLNQPCWTEPYCDWEPDDSPDLQTQKLVSYCKPLTDSNGEFIGTISLDLSLPWLSETISAVKPYPRSYSILVGRGGTFLIHPDESRLFYETIFTRNLMDPDPDMEALGQAMIGWEEGMRRVKVDGERSFVFFKPLKSTGWSMGIVCPEKEVFSGINRLRGIGTALMILGLLLMLFICFRVIDSTVKPLRALAGQAEEIASGHFDVSLPAENREDEIGTLSRSFSHMQSSLVSYIEELKLTTAKKERIEGELQIARDIQNRMVPHTFPDRKDVDLYASMTPAKEVGGDLYDFFLQGDELYFCIGDVSGKGVPASLLMAMARSLFRSMGQQGLPPTEIAARINEMHARDNDQMMFVTLFIGVADLKTGRLSFCNCGHNPPVILSKGMAAAYLECKPNTPIGVWPGWAYEGQVVDDLRGRKLFLYTDGLNEAENPAHEEFGNDRMLEALATLSGKGCKDLVEGMDAAVKVHVDGAEASDDLTLMCIAFS